MRDRDRENFSAAGLVEGGLVRFVKREWRICFPDAVRASLRLARA
jgi:hypothetical protein